MPELSVVIPCYNELRNLENGALDEVELYLKTLTITWEVVVVDDGSDDGSLEFARNFSDSHSGFQALTIPHGGKPAAVWEGIQKSAGNIVLFTDMDQSTPLHHWDLLAPKFKEGFDVAIGSRGGERDGFSPLRQLGSRAFRAFRKSLLLPQIDDTQCGFKACRRDAAMDHFPRLQFFQRDVKPRGWKVSAFDVELLYLFVNAGLRVAEVPVTWSHRDLSDTKGAISERQRYIYESVEMLKEVTRVRINALRGVYSRTNNA